MVLLKSAAACLSVGPILVVEPRPVTVDVDSDVTLNCKWSGNPPLTLTWTKKGSSMVRARISSNFIYIKMCRGGKGGQSTTCWR